MDYPEEKDLGSYHCPYCGKELVSLAYADDPGRYDYEREPNETLSADISGLCENHFCAQYDTEIILTDVII